MLNEQYNNIQEANFLNQIASKNFYSEFILDNILNTKLGILKYTVEDLQYKNNKYCAEISCNISEYILNIKIEFSKVFYEESVQIFLSSVNSFSFIEPIQYSMENFKQVINLAKEQHLYASYISCEIFMENLSKYENLEIDYSFMDSDSYIVVENKSTKKRLKLLISDNCIYVSHMDKDIAFLNYIGFTHLANQDCVLNSLLYELNFFGDICNYELDFLGGKTISDLNILINKIYTDFEATHCLNVLEKTYSIYYKNTEKSLDYKATIHYDEIYKHFILTLYMFGVPKFFIYEHLEDLYSFENKVFKTLYGG